MRKLPIATLFAVALLPSTLSAQANVEGRVGKLESEMRAVQRKVFGTTGPLIQPEVVAPEQPVGPGPGTPATNAVIDVTQRVTSLEGQMATLTGQIEQNQYQIRRLQEQFDAYRRATDDRVRAIEAPGGAAAAGATQPATGASEDNVRVPESPRAGTRSGSGSGTATAATTPARVAEATGPASPPRTDAGRAGRASAVTKPASGDAPEDEYLYGYRLWAAKLYPEAEAQLKKVAADYPKHRRASYAKNLLGRSYLDEGKPSLASVTFYDNYKTLPDGERAPESLYYLAQALVTLKKPADACKVYGELTDVYAGRIAASMKADIAKGRAAAKCG